MSNPTITNCILWNDIATDGEISSILGSGASTPTVNNSDVQGGFAGNNNIDVDPLFVDASDGDDQLTSDSPCTTWATHRARHRGCEQ